MSTEESRLRPHPSARFAGESHVFDLGKALRELRAESHPAQQGHRQITLFHRAPVTKVLFAFEAGGELPGHKANGLVTIHALEDGLTVQAADESFELKAGMIVVLGPNIPHSVRSEAASAMLLTVHLEG